MKTLLILSFMASFLYPMEYLIESKENLQLIEKKIDDGYCTYIDHKNKVDSLFFNNREDCTLSYHKTRFYDFELFCCKKKITTYKVKNMEIK